MSTGLAFALALLVGHLVGDHLLQTDHQAAHKQAPSIAGYRALAGHVVGYTAAQVVALAGVVAAGITVSLTGAVAALAISAVTHWVIDRGCLLARLAVWTRTTAYHATPAVRAAQDQALHALCLGIAVVAGTTF